MGQVRGLENVDLRYAAVTISYCGPEEEFNRNGQRVRYMTGLTSYPSRRMANLRPTPIPPGKY